MPVRVPRPFPCLALQTPRVPAETDLFEGRIRIALELASALREPSCAADQRSHLGILGRANPPGAGERGTPSLDGVEDRLRAPRSQCGLQVHSLEADAVGRRRGHGLDGAQSLPLLSQKAVALAHGSEPSAPIVRRERDQSADHLGANLGAEREPRGRRKQAQTFGGRLGRPSAHGALGDDQLEVDGDAVGPRYRPGPVGQLCGVVRQAEEDPRSRPVVDQEPVPGVDRDQAGPQVEQVVARTTRASPDPPGERDRLGVPPKAHETSRLPDLRVDEVSPRAGVRQDRRCATEGVCRLRQQTRLVEDGGLVHQPDAGMLWRRVPSCLVHGPQGGGKIAAQEPGVTQVVLRHELDRGLAHVAGEQTTALEIIHRDIQLAGLETEPTSIDQDRDQVPVLADSVQSRVELSPGETQLPHAHQLQAAVATDDRHHRVVTSTQREVVCSVEVPHDRVPIGASLVLAGGDTHEYPSTGTKDVLPGLVELIEPAQRGPIRPQGETEPAVRSSARPCPLDLIQHRLETVHASPHVPTRVGHLPPTARRSLR
ncbi:MAG TPA: hypothetical protein VN027_15685 [Isoptericola sp.]|nr:hypothetical protein [Isoptericola sp.]